MEEDYAKQVAGRYGVLTPTGQCKGDSFLGREWGWIRAAELAAGFGRVGFGRQEGVVLI